MGQIVLAFLLCVLAPYLMFGEPSPARGNFDPGEPLFLTPYIRAGNMEEARNLSAVGEIEGMVGVVSYSGYFTVNAQHNSSLFFWYFQAQNNSKDAPIILWLEGGPGSDDTSIIFARIGPYLLNAQHRLMPNNYTWIKNYNVIFIDNPVGTGYSFTDSDAGYAQNEEDVARDIDNAVRQFFAMFSELSENKFYLAGVSYAGKYIPALGYQIHKDNPTAVIKVNLKGVSIGNGLVDPITQTDYSSYLYGIGLIDQKQRADFRQAYAQIVNHVLNGQTQDSWTIIDKVLLGKRWPYPTLYKNATGLDNINNYLKPSVKGDVDYRAFVQQPDVRRAIHVGNQTLHNGTKVEDFLLGDIMNSTKIYLEFLIDHDYQVMLYSGQLDIVVAYAMTVNMIATMTWKTASDYRAAPRLIWKVDPRDEMVSGYARSASNFAEVMVLGAGHMVVAENPRAALDLIDRLIRKTPWA